MSAFFLNPAAAQDSNPVLLSIDVHEADSIIRIYTDSVHFYILDVRTASEYAGGFIADATNLDYNGSGFSDSLKQLNRDHIYLVYCHAGGRSYAAFNVMKNLGFTHVYNMTGGISAWIAAGYPINTGTGVRLFSNEFNPIRIYPNPLTPESVIRVSPDIQEVLQIKISNALGAQIRFIEATAGQIVDLRVNDLRSGLYFYSVGIKNTQIQSGRFIVH